MSFVSWVVLYHCWTKYRMGNSECQCTCVIPHVLARFLSCCVGSHMDGGHHYTYAVNNLHSCKLQNAITFQDGHVTNLSDLTGLGKSLIKGPAMQVWTTSLQQTFAVTVYNNDMPDVTKIHRNSWQHLKMLGVGWEARSWGTPFLPLDEILV